MKSNYWDKEERYTDKERVRQALRYRRNKTKRWAQGEDVKFVEFKKHENLQQ